MPFSKIYKACLLNKVIHPWSHNCPIHQWDKIVDQAELTMNSLRNSRVNPNLSAWAYLFGNHDFNKVPLAPPGAKIVLHSKPTQQKLGVSW